MSKKLFFAALLSLTAAVSLSAQAQEQLHSAQIGQSVLADMVGSLTQNALFTLLGAIVLVGIIWICYVLIACAQLNRPQGNARRSVINLLVLVAGLSSFCSSCSVEQRAMATRYRALETAENRDCPSQQHYVNYVNSPFNSRHPYNEQSPAFCKQCGQRIFNSKH